MSSSTLIFLFRLRDDLLPQPTRPHHSANSGSQAVRLALNPILQTSTLKVLLYHIENDIESWPIDGATIKVIRDLQTLATDISDKALTYVEASDPMPNTKAKCHISSQCWTKMTQMGYNSYSLTHEIFYIMIAYQMGCQEEMNKQRTLLNQPPPADLAKTFCASVYLEALQIEKNNFPELRRDLFMEQAALCGAMGYRWFFTPEWLETIISWQDNESGCYKGETIRESDVEFRGTESSLNLRVKREERVLEDGCLSHTTAVAAGALAMYVRYIAEYQQMVFEQNQIFN
ncbi:UPF0764 protein C16orf89 homolog [Ruditapes philippinarum]|uniref:UPF0764 protein C16orf89 homolog n=1 Tax=Ruditapes philippinarum TaxID=129788 RepID=UPI00295BC54F|nr:UPF0764 protein C16orf89 homolog [Ruditapes philippinarum]